MPALASSSSLCTMAENWLLTCKRHQITTAFCFEDSMKLLADRAPPLCVVFYELGHARHGLGAAQQAFDLVQG